MKVLVTGANGFVGSAACEVFAKSGHKVLALTRRSKTLSISEQSPHVFTALTANFDDVSSMQDHLIGCDAIVHCAARVHQVHEESSDPLTQYRRVNTQATLALAQAAAQTGVKRFVFLSSVKVNGEYTAPGQPFKSSQAAPQDPYGISKWEAEQGLREIAKQTGLEVVIIRPPLVYGPGVKANFLTMMQWLQRGIPLPLGAIRNQRSLVALPNLMDFIALCLTHPKAANQTFMVSDHHDVSTPQLLHELGMALHHPARLIPIPQNVMQWCLTTIGKAALAQRLCGNLTVDSSAAAEQLGWNPPVTRSEALQLTANHFLTQQQVSLH